jgi:hypothetical protein
MASTKEVTDMAIKSNLTLTLRMSNQTRVREKVGGCMKFKTMEVSPVSLVAEVLLLPKSMLKTNVKHATKKKKEI